MTIEKLRYQFKHSGSDKGRNLDNIYDKWNLITYNDEDKI